MTLLSAPVRIIPKKILVGILVLVVGLTATSTTLSSSSLVFVSAQEEQEPEESQSQLPEVLQYYECTYTDPIELENWGDGTVFMEYYSNLQAAVPTITMRITYMDGDDAWVGIGINTDDDHHMTNSWAVIGDANRGVKRYWMTSEERDASGVWELDDVHNQLRDASFVQEDGQSILEFTMDIVIKDEDEDATVDHVISPNSHWIWGVGLSENRWQGIHNELGFFDGLPIFNGCVLMNITESPTESPLEVLDPIDVVYSDNDTEEDTEEEDELTEDQTGGGGDDNNNIQSSPASQINFGSSSVSESDAGLTRGMWVAHGILLALAWGVFAPIAIGAAYLRKMKFLQRDALWLNLHFYMSFACVCFTVSGFIFGILAANREGEDTHFQKDTHHKVGLSIFILVIVQALAGYFRPSNSPVVPNTSRDESEKTATHNDGDGKEVETSLNTTMELDDGEKSDVAPPPPPQTPSSSSSPTIIRRYWEYCHRFLGVALLGLAWYNCTSGIVLQSEKYPEDDQQMLINIFWGITGSIAGLVFFVGYVLRVE